jgi:hypothetical protein
VSETPTPSVLDALDGDGNSINKTDLLLGYVRGLVAQVKMTLVRLEQGDRILADHTREIEALNRKLGHKTKPEPSWWVRAAVIAAITTGTNLVLLFVLKGGLAKLIASAAAAGAAP